MNTKQLTYRQATPPNGKTMALILERAIAMRDSKPLPTYIQNKATLEDLRIRMNKLEAWTELAICREKIVGFIACCPSAQTDSIPTDPTTAYLSLIMVEPDYWGQGIASRLLDRAADHVRTTDRRQLIVWTGDTNNAHARAVYEHKGYRLTAETRDSKYGAQVQYALDLRGHYPRVH